MFTATDAIGISLVLFTFIAFVSLYNNWKRSKDAAAAKTDVDGHFQALYARIDELDKEKKRIERIDSLVDRNHKDLTAILDDQSDELFSVQSTLKALGEQMSQKKTSKRKKLTKKKSKR